MITVNRLRLRASQAMHEWQARRLIANANRMLARSSRTANPGYDELRHPMFIGVMVLAFIVLVIDVSDGWSRLDTVVAMLASVVSTIKAGA